MSNQFKDAETVSSMINNMGFKPDNFCEGMKHQHRTLQQAFTRLCLAWINTCAKDDYLYDGRNEASHEVCAEIVKKMEKEPCWEYLPYI